MKQPPAHTIVPGVIFMFPNGEYTFGIWNSDDYRLGSVLFEKYLGFENLPEEVRMYLAEHERELRNEKDVDRLISMYKKKK